ncbi:MAG: tRNA (N(6)-L-threonylcarbamoyladenosine(37)-C(2))-methylthiotransferase MtaB [Desulfobacterales bacterium]|jgi:threonylcarbamoyladenosine tRNA methylthiotransferase MtaB|nr:tRNA (N(6)-L-threonylcarbamoyladenosine(37)-C(2))-methylthiotransferase MtaB [Desulfobacterales bacterium]
MKKEIFEIITLGCKVNQSESATMSAKLTAYGCQAFKPTDMNPDAAISGENVTICIINTCTVTEKASMQSRQAIRKAIRNHPNAKIIVTGCYAQTQPEELIKIKGVDDIVGRGGKSSIPEKIFIESPLSKPPTTFLSLPAFAHRTRAFLKIQDGCNAKCTYCIVPRARGASQSMPYEQVLAQIKRLEQTGYKEIVLCGIHMGTYGRDLDPVTDLEKLLTGIEESNTTARIRLSSIEPREISDEIISLVAKSKKLCHHFHIPLQSGDDGILKKMGRPYSGAFFRALILKIHQQIPNAAIGIDTLIGFPGESDAAFNQTYDLVESLPITYLHAFPFSPRDKTPAAKLPGRVPFDIVKDRCRKMRALGAQKKKLFYEGMRGKIASVLVEGRSTPETGRYKGTTSNYVPVYLIGAAPIKNTMVQVRVERFLGERGVIGSLVTSKD